MSVRQNVYTIPEVASLLKIGRNAAYRLANSGQLRTVRIGRSVRVPLSALEEFLKGEVSA